MFISALYPHFNTASYKNNGGVDVKAQLEVVKKDIWPQFRAGYFAVFHPGQFTCQYLISGIKKGCFL